MKKTQRKLLVTVLPNSMPTKMITNIAVLSKPRKDKTEKENNRHIFNEY